MVKNGDKEVDMLVYGHIKGECNGFDRYVIENCTTKYILAVVEADIYGQFLANLTSVGCGLSEEDLSDIESEIDIISSEGGFPIEMAWL
jgi:hypothetical protein